VRSGAHHLDLLTPAEGGRIRPDPKEYHRELARDSDGCLGIVFAGDEPVPQFRNSSGWEVGANAKVIMIDQGKAADINAVIADSPGRGPSSSVSRG
jgi:hypothetical protein